MIKVSRAVIIDDHQLFADSFSLLLEKYKLFEQIYLSYTIEDFNDFLIALDKKDVYIFLDYYLKEKNGLSLLPEIKRLNKNARIVFVTSATSPSVIQNILFSKPHGIISKFCDPATLIECIQHVEAKESFLDTHIEKILKDYHAQFPTFTPRELELLRYFADGLNIADTADKISLSMHTIIAHRRKMMKKANCHSMGQLIKYAQDHELI